MHTYKSESQQMHTISISYPLAPPMVDMGDKEASVRDPQRARGSHVNLSGSEPPMYNQEGRHHKQPLRQDLLVVDG